MGELGKRVAVGALFLTTGAMSLGADMFAGNAKQDRIEHCATLETDPQKACLSNVSDHYNVEGALDAIELGSFLGAFFTGFLIYESLSETGEDKRRTAAAPIAGQIITSSATEA